MLKFPFPVTFSECGFNPLAYDCDLIAAREAIQLACDYLMDSIYFEFNECDVIDNYRDIRIDWIANTVIIPVNYVYKPEYLN